MPATPLFFGVKIILRDSAAPVTENTDIGLYNVAGDNSQFRWIQYNTATGTVQNGAGGAWLACKSNILIERGISTFSKSVDLKRGGNTASPGSGRISIRSYLPDGNKFSTYCAANGIYLNGCIAQIMIVENSVWRPLWYGVCEFPSWDKEKYEIPLRGVNNKRNTNITKIISASNRLNASANIIGKSIPVTFGKVYDSVDSKGTVTQYGQCKALQTADKINDLKISPTPYVFGDTGYSVTGLDDSGIKTFPVRATVATNVSEFTVSLGSDLTWYLDGTPTSLPLDLSTYFSENDWYIMVSEGGNSEGSYRKITGFTIALVGAESVATITLAQTLSYSVNGNSTYDATNQTWILIQQIFTDYEFDTWPCEGYSDLNGVVSTLAYSARWNAYKDGLFSPLPNTLISPESSGPEKVNLNPKGFDATPYQIKDFTFVPCTSSSRCADSSMAAYLTDGVDYTPRGNGVFGTATPAPSMFSSGYPHNGSTAPYTGVGDRVEATFFDYGLNSMYAHHLAGGELSYALCVEIVPPELPDKNPFDALYLAVWARMKEAVTSGTESGDYLHTIFAKMKRKIGNGADGLYNIVAQPNDLVDREQFAVMHDFPNDYFNPVGSSSPDSNFYSDYKLATWLSGYMNYPLTGIENYEQYKLVSKFALIHHAYHKYTSSDFYFDLDFELYEAAVVIKRTYSLGNEIYTSLSGRKFDDTWGSRKTAAACIQSPVDILEHVCRLQNWSELCAPPTGGWGSDYATSVLVATSGAGSFDSTDGGLATVKNFKAAAQLQDYDSCYSGKIKQTLCRNFFLVNYVDKTGQECVTRVAPSPTSPTDALTLKQIKPGSVSIREPNPADIFPEIFVRYAKNNASEDLQKTIRILNAGGTYAASCVEGMTGEEASYYWTLCNTLWKKSGNTEQPSSDLTDLVWANGPDADLIAKEYLQQLIVWMGLNQITLTTNLAVILEWSAWPEEGHRFTIQLPFETANSVVECIIDSISVDPNSPFDVIINAYMLPTDAAEDWDIQKTFGTLAASGDNWVNSLAAQGGSNDIDAKF